MRNKKDQVISRRKFIAGLAGAGAAMGMGFQPIAYANKLKNPVLKIGYIPITDAAPLLIAHSKGMFRKAGITTADPVMIPGWSELAMAFATGAFNLSHLLSPIPLYLRYAKNIPIKVVAWDHINNSALTVRKEDRIYEINDLAGKKIAIPFWYSVHNIILQFALRQYDLTAVVSRPEREVLPNEVELLEMAPSDMVFALKNGLIDGYIVAEPYNAAGEILYGGRILRFSGDIWKNHACCQAVMHEQDIALYPEWAQGVVDVLVEAELWLTGNIEEAALILSSDGEKYIDLPREILMRAMTKYDLETYGPKGTNAIRHTEWTDKRVSFEPFPFKSYTRTLVDLMRKTTIDGDLSFLERHSTEFIVNDIVNYELIGKSLRKNGHVLIRGIDITKTKERTEVLSV
ncbi:MAG: ABC transporter substrate-binding protein [Candidatus Desulfatibia sp.]|uniref:ABC transporter substrate-binding protein n=1 Tax=Candidatus Desulfatibia sp. TaxID=3101189 RepID=UPI002F310CCF